MSRLHHLIGRGLKQSARTWPALQAAYSWVARVAEVLSNPEGLKGCQVRQRMAGLVSALERSLGRRRGPHHAALAHFLLETRRYWPGLFHCYDVDGLPRTNNALEQLFGSARFHERRSSGRRRGSEGLVVRGQVRIVAAAATRLAPVQGKELAPKNPAAWLKLRATLRERRRPRVMGRRFRKDPAVYLQGLEAQLRRALPT